MYYLIEISHGDSKIEGKAIYQYESKNDAIANFHSKLGTAMKSALYTSDLLMVIDQIGNVIARELYVAEIKAEKES